jgi:L-2-hydroxyglutarate oxidase LhgO
MDLIVSGGGILGLATARAVAEARTATRLVVVEKESELAFHQSGHNSGVVHAGIYYRPGSLKARLCRAGKVELEAYAAERGIPLEQSGKLIVARDESELDRLAGLQRRAEANGVPGLQRVDAGGIAAIEPHASGVAGLFSPTTGVVDFPTVARSLAGDVEAAGGEVRTGVRVFATTERAGGVVVETDAGDIHGSVALACAGLHADRLARTGGLEVDDRIIPFKGHYYRLRDPGLVRGNIYPVPDPAFPFLGVHLTRRIDGEVWIGPTATLATGREAYRGIGGLSAADLRSSLTFPGLYRFLAANPGTVLREMPYGVSRRLYARQVRRYVPGVGAADLEPGPSGIRAQLMTREGRLVDDFSFAESARAVHVLNAPSPAATAAFAIGRHLAGKVIARL